MTTCSIAHCPRVIHARGWCRIHYKHWWKFGDPLAGPFHDERDEAARFWDTVDTSGDCWLWTGPCGSNGYGLFRLSETKKVGAHRYAWAFTNGPIPAGLEIDHNWTCPKTCVHPDHLRLATTPQNHQNLAGPPSHNTSGTLGVSWDKARGKWRASVKHNGHHWSQRFNTRQEAEEAAMARRLALFTHNDKDRA